MDVCYNKLFKLLIDKNMKKTEFSKVAGISANTLAKLSKNDYVSMEVLVKICRTLECTPNDIMDILPSEKREVQMNINEPYKATFTREQFLFHEMRTVSQLMVEGKNDEEIKQLVLDDNLFQYPTEKSVDRMVRNCLKRLHLLEDMRLVNIIANGASDSAKQVCLYAMMNQYRVIYEFMIGVIGEKYRLKDFSFSKTDVNVFFSRLQEQSDVVASWSNSTINKLKQVLIKMLVDTEYLDSTKSETLNVVLIDLDLKNILIDKRDYASLSVFNYFEGE